MFFASENAENAILTNTMIKSYLVNLLLKLNHQDVISELFGHLLQQHQDLLITLGSP